MTGKRQLGDILVEAGIITVKTLERALERQKRSGRRLGAVLEEMGVLTDDELVSALARQFSFKTVRDFAGRTFSWETLRHIQEDLAVQKQVFPLKEMDGSLAVAISDPFDTDTLDFLSKKTGMKIFPVLATRKDILDAIKNHYLGGGNVDEERQTVLIVDDSTSITAVIETALKKEGYNVLVANDGISGLKLALTHLPGLIICDTVMPRMDGYALMRAIKENPATSAIPMILLTSKATGDDEQKALTSGFLDFIPKPVQPIRVVTRVRRAFELADALRR